VLEYGVPRSMKRWSCSGSKAIARSSIQGGKDQLFLAALERYREIQAWPLWIGEFFCPM
jgi:hypothetical protein